MVDLISPKGVGAPGLPNWSWCVPAGLSPERMPVVVQCMTQDGLRFLPTSIAAPRECRDGRLEHVELLPSENDINIAEDLWAWLTSAWQAKPDAERIVKAIGVPDDLLATARFVSMSVVPCLPAEHDIPESALFLGRSVQVRVGGLARVVTA
jgi:hypothetical protein